MKKKNLVTSCHGHILCQTLTPPEIFFGNFPGIDKGTISAFIDACRVTGAPAIFDHILSRFGINSIRFNDFMEIYQSNPKEVVGKLLNEMDEAGLDRMVIHMLDLATAGSDKYYEMPWEQQVDFFGSLGDITNGRLIPFYGFDPRRKDAFNLFKNAIENKGFKGAKLYTKLGWHPYHRSGVNTKEVNNELYQFYFYCEKNKIPLENHTSGGGIRGELSEHDADELEKPQNWYNILVEFPFLKISFAHFGGNSCFIKTLHKIKKTGMPSAFNKKMNDTEFILFLMMEYENVFTNIAFHNGFNSSEWQEAMVILFSLPFGPDRVLGGDDWPLHKLQYGLKEFYETIRKKLGERIWNSLMIWNHESYLVNNL